MSAPSHSWQAALGPARLLAEQGRLRSRRCAGRRASIRPADRPDLSAIAPSAEEAIPAVGFEARDANTLRHGEAVEHLSRTGIDSPQLAFVTFPRTMPKLAVDPGNPGDEAVRLDGPQDLSC